MNLIWWSRICTWLGCIVGLILQDCPNKKPALKSWISWNNLYAVFITLIQFSFFLSVAANTSDKLDLTTESNHLNLQKVITDALFYFSTALVVCNRGYFWFQAKGLVQFTNSLESHQLFGSQLENGYSNWKLNAFAGMLVLLRLTTAIMYEIKLVREGVLGEIWFKIFNFWPLLVIATFCTIFTTLVLFISVGFVITRTTQLINALDDFCDQLEYYKQLNLSEMQIKSVDYDYKQKKQNVWMVSGGLLVWKIQEIQAMFKEYDRLYGPLLLFLIIINFIGVLNGVNSFLSTTNSEFGLVSDIFGTVSEFFFVLLLMELGHQVHERVSFYFEKHSY